ncbi:MAG: hypothetical protein GC168_19030 [Candidatus Hydrogenedens sp.]|nr:hypothetical protein [Candidatus Hydrogenedens sp.]
MGTPPLNVVQRWFQSVVTHPQGVEAGMESGAALEVLPLRRDELERMVTSSARLSAVERMAIYAHAYHARLIECLGESFPVLKRTLGDEVFNGFAFGYIQSYPSRSYTLNHLADRFADYLSETSPSGDGDWPALLVDLARLEWSIEQVFDGPGLEGKRPLKPEDLDAIPESAWPGLRLELAPCVRLLTARFPVNDYYTAARYAAPGEMPPIPAAHDTYMLLTRREYIVRRHDLLPEQHALLDALRTGSTLAEAVERAAESSALDDAAFGAQLQDWFAAWTRHEIFASVLP